jgi:glutamate/tyrosine decarboxylase-like PLP-dependent enzyme
VYAALLAYGRDGYAEIFARQVRLARGISAFIHTNEHYELLPEGRVKDPEGFHIIVIFRAKDEKTNAELVKRINGTRKMYVSGTKWGGLPACRIAISTWRVDVDRDLKLVTGVLEEVL